MSTFAVGDNVRFIRDYRLDLPPEHEGVGHVPKGEQGRIVFSDDSFVLVELAKSHERVPVWRVGQLSEHSATTVVLESTTKKP